MGTWAQRVDAARRRVHVLRQGEEARFDAFLEDPQARLFVLHGMPGSGKTALLERFAEKAGEAVQLLHPDTPPTEFSCRVDPAARVIFVDDFHLLRPVLPNLFRSVFPNLGDNQKLVTAGRAPLPASVLHDPGWASITAIRELEPMTAQESEELLRRAGVPDSSLAGLCALGAGHPLALRTMAKHWDGFDWGELHEVRRAFLEHMLDGLSAVERRVLEVAAINLAATPELLKRVEPALADAFQAATELPVVSRERGGIALAPVLREPLVQELTHTTPDLRDSILRVSLAHADEKTNVGPQDRRAFWAANSVELIGRALKRGSSLTHGGWTRSGVRRQHVERVVEATRRHLGEESGRRARHWLACHPRGAALAWSGDELVAYVHFLELDRLAARQIDDDPAVRAFADFARDQCATRARLARFYLPFTPQGLPFVVKETTARLLFGVDLELACSAQPDSFLEQYRELGAHPKVAHLIADGEPWSISCEDLRRYTAADLHRVWSQLCQADPSLLGDARAFDARDFSSAEAATELRKALRAFHDARRLAQSPLTNSAQVRALLASGEQADTAHALRMVLRRLVAELGTTGADGQARRVLEASFFEEPRKQLAIARGLGVGESTYRRHLKLAVERLSELWVTRRGHASER